jgi:hypothetical protein
MPQVQLNDQVFQAAQRRAAAGGYSSVDDYIADVVVQDLDESGDNLSHIFTPERIASLEQISAEIKAGGKTYSMDEVKEHFEDRRKAWLANHAS